MPFEKLESFWEAAKKSASEAGKALNDGVAAIPETLGAFTSSQRPEPASDAAATHNNADTNYETLAALKPIQKLVSEAGAAIDDKARTLLDNDIPELLGAAGGVGAGVAAGAGILTVSAASGTAGAAALTSGLATAGAIVGGGMIAGIGVVAAPAVVLGAAGVWAVGQYNKNRLCQAKETLLQEALRKRDALLSELRNTTSSNHERVRYLSSLVAQLAAAAEKLQADIGEPDESK
jgi:hypothetical protein